MIFSLFVRLIGVLLMAFGVGLAVYGDAQQRNDPFYVGAVLAVSGLALTIFGLPKGGNSE